MSFSVKSITVAGAILLLSASTCVFAGKDPISVSVTPSSGLPSSTSVGSSYAVIYTLTNNLPFAEPLKQVLRNTEGLGFTVNDACSNKTLAAKGGTCIIDVVFHPVQSGAASLGLTMQYDRNVVPLTTLSTTAASSSTESISGVVATRLPASSQVNVTYPVKFTFTNNTDASITASSVPFTGDSGNLSSISNGCTAALARHSSCDITAIYTPTVAGHNSVGATYFYQSGTLSVALSTATISSGSSGSCADVSGQTNLLLPSSTYQYADNIVQFQFTNNCDSNSATLGTVSLSATLGGSSIKHAQKGKKQNQLGATTTTLLTKGTDNCSNTTLAANASCTVSAAIVPQTIGSKLDINAVVNYTEASQSKQSTATTSSSSVLSNDNTNRIITVVNQCNFPVWMTFNAGNVSNNGKPCSPDKAGRQDCPTNTYCNTSADGGNGLCYWSNPSLDGAHPNGKLAGAVANAAPDVMNIAVSENYGNGVSGNTVYNAGIEGRLGCTGSGTSVSCDINTCTTGADGMCLPGNGPGTTPVAFNAVEFTFNHSTAGGATDGVYNNQIIDGINVPLEMKGRGASSLGSVPYNSCSATGTTIQPSTGSASTQLGNCTFAFSPTGDATNFRYVTEVGAPSPTTLCDTNSDCTGGNICGLGYDAGTNKINKICGTLQGYVSVNKGICSQAKSTFGVNKSGDNLQTTLYDGVFHCDTTYDSNAYSAKNLYACSGSLSNASCYNGASPCCGCIDWWLSTGGSITVPTSTISCNGVTNSNWNTVAQPDFQWVKTACPTSYVYQYDDKSSSFICNVTNSGNIVTNYQVTFCPEGKQLS